MRTLLSYAGVLAVLALPLTGCSGDDNPPAASTQYLGLGDSIAYGDNGFKPYSKDVRPNGSAFVGYPDLVGRQVFSGKYLNLGCPGATTGSFSSADVMDNGCRSIQMDYLQALHVPYTSTEADKARELLSSNDVKLITLSLGGNDLLLTLHACDELTPNDAKASLACALQKLPGTLDQGVANLTSILKRFRDDGFKGQIVYVNLYSTYVPSSSATLAVSVWNSKMAPVVTDAGGQVADVFQAFADASQAAGGDPCAAGLLIPNPDPGATPACDVHPSAMGAQLLADTVEALPGIGP